MIVCKDVIKVYSDPVTDSKVSALRGLDFFLKKGEVASVIGPSGAGKSTFIKVLSGLELPTSGVVMIDDVNIVNLTDNEMRDFRFNKMGIINQFVHQNLLSNLTVEKNLYFPMKMRYFSRERAKKEVERLLKVLNLEKIRTNPVTKISGGEAVRTSIGVALAANPVMILADEPTGQLDTANTNDIIETFRDLNNEMDTTIVVVTHDLRFRNAFKKSYIIRDGRLVGINADMDRNELDFIVKPQESSLQSFIDSSQFVRVPDEVYSKGNYSHMVEFEIHPSNKFSMMFNPSEVNKKEIWDILEHPEQYTEQHKQSKEKKDTKVKFSEVKPLLEQEFESPDETAKTIIEVNKLNKSFPAGRIMNHVVKDVSFNIKQGDFVIVSGKSGAGKTTLINLLAGIEKPDSGKIDIFNFDMTKRDSDKRSDFRFYNVSMISQINNLFNQYTVLDNMFIPQIYNEKNRLDKEQLIEIAKDCNIDEKLTQYSLELSGGEKQRAALAKALSRRTPIIFADEPTANLDNQLAKQIISLLIETARKYNVTIIMSTHDLSLVRPGFRLIRLKDGEIEDDLRVTKNRLKDILQIYLNVEIDDDEETSNVEEAVA